VQPVAAGSTVHLSDPVLPPDEGTVLLCCAVPTTDVTVSA
jgi:hypothetical protein